MTEGGSQSRDGRSRRQSKEDTKLDLLQTGRRLLIEQGVPGRINIRLTDVLKEKGLTTGAAYHIWSSQKEFQEELAAFIAAEFTWAGTKVLPSVDVDHGDPQSSDRIRALGKAYFQAFREREEFYITLQLWGIQDPPDEVSEAILEGYRVVHDDLAEVFERNLTVSGRRWRQGFDVGDVATMVTAMCEGLALRGRFDEDRLTADGGADLFGEGLVALYHHLTEPIDGAGDGGPDGGA